MQKVINHYRNVHVPLDSPKLGSKANKVSNNFLAI